MFRGFHQNSFSSLHAQERTETKCETTEIKKEDTTVKLTTLLELEDTLMVHRGEDIEVARIEEMW